MKGKSHSKQLLPPFSLFEPSAKLVLANALTFFVLLAIPTILASIPGPAVEITSDMSLEQIMTEMQNAVTPLMMAGSLLSLIFMGPLTYAQVRVAAGKNVELHEAFDGFRYALRVIGASLLVAFLVMLGMLALIIPGFILLRRYIFAPFLVVDKNLGVIESMQQSAAMTRSHSWSIYGIVFVVILFGIIASIGVPGLIVGTTLVILYSLAFALRYQEIKKLEK